MFYNENIRTKIMKVQYSDISMTFECIIDLILNLYKLDYGGK